MNNIEPLKTLWKQLLGELPPDADFKYFESPNHRVRFATRVMLERQKLGEQR